MYLIDMMLIAFLCLLWATLIGLLIWWSVTAPVPGWVYDLAALVCHAYLVGLAVLSVWWPSRWLRRRLPWTGGRL